MRSSDEDAVRMCADDKLVQHGCAVLRQEVVEFSTESTLSVTNLQEYFISTSGDAEAFVKATGIQGGVFSCRSLCEETLRYISTEMDLVIPPEHNKYCSEGDAAGCSVWKSIGEDFMTKVATDLDMSAGENDEDGDAVAHHQEIIDVPEDRQAAPRTSFDYTTDELALRVAFIFDVFPSEAFDFAHPDFIQHLTHPDAGLDLHANHIMEGYDQQDADSYEVDIVPSLVQHAQEAKEASLLEAPPEYFPEVPQSA